MENDELVEIERVRRGADLLYDETTVARTVREMAIQVTHDLAETNPLVICVMNGGLMLTGWLTPYLNFPLQLDYAHVTRYRGGTQGGSLQWIAKPRALLEDRTLLLVDDIFDQGVTLGCLVDACRQLGARDIKTAVLVQKLHDRVATDMRPDFVGLTVPDRYVFGCGMDYRHYLRNLPAIYAVHD
ncbi:MAG: hypoxanthine-guanine phosphoribosyltransferase [Gammaproteobacteria bacterium]